MRTVWNKRAKTDLYQNIGYIAERSPQNALKVLTEVLSFSETLKDFPHKYPKEPIYDKENIRFAVIYSFKMVYRADPKQITILRLFHTKQNPNKI